MKIYRKYADNFAEHAAIYWGGLSHLNSLLVVVNVSLFFATGLVIEHGYTYTFYSLFCLMVVAGGILVPVGGVSKLWYYLVFLVFEVVAIWFIVVSVVFWVEMGRV